MRQANEFMSVLERINTVGMAVHELDRIPDRQEELKNGVRAYLVKLLVGSRRQQSAQEEDNSQEPEKKT